MVASFNRMEPTNPSKLYANPKVNDAFQKSNWLEYLSIPYYFLQSLREMSSKVQVGKVDALAHHGIIKIIVNDTLDGQS